MENHYTDIEKLAELRDKGLLTEQEFQQKKNQILGNQQPKPTPQPKKKGGCGKAAIIGIGLFFGIAFLGSVFSEDEKTTTTEQSASKPKSNKEIVSNLDETIKAIKEDKDPYKDNMETVNKYLVLFEGFGVINNQWSDSTDPEVKAKLAEFRKIAGNYQARLLPKMRKTYTKTIKEKLWRANIEVANLGGNNTTIQLTGGALANNANKEDTMNAISELAKKLRFKRINMKWYKYDDEYTYYDLETPNDSELFGKK